MLQVSEGTSMSLDNNHRFVVSAPLKIVDIYPRTWIVAQHSLDKKFYVLHIHIRTCSSDIDIFKGADTGGGIVLVPTPAKGEPYDTSLAEFALQHLMFELCLPGNLRLLTVWLEVNEKGLITTGARDTLLADVDEETSEHLNWFVLQVLSNLSECTTFAAA